MINAAITQIESWLVCTAKFFGPASSKRHWQIPSLAFISTGVLTVNSESAPEEFPCSKQDNILIVELAACYAVCS